MLYSVELRSRYLLFAVAKLDILFYIRKKKVKNLHKTFFLKISLEKFCQYKNNTYLCIANEKTRLPNAKIAQLVEHNLAKVGVAGSSPVFRSSTLKYFQATLKFNFHQCENSSVGRAQPCQGWGRGFESRFSLKFSKLEFSSGWWNW